MVSKYCDWSLSSKWSYRRAIIWNKRKLGLTGIKFYRPFQMHFFNENFFFHIKISNLSPHFMDRESAGKSGNVKHWKYLDMINTSIHKLTLQKQCLLIYITSYNTQIPDDIRKIQRISSVARGTFDERFFVIQIRWKFNFALIQVVNQWLLWNFAHGMTALLLWHVQNVLAI